MVCCHSQVIQRRNITSLDTSSLISCSSAKNSSLLWLPKIFFFWHKHLSITLNLKYPEKPNHDLWPKHYAKFILEIGQWGSNGPPSVILGGPFQERGSMGRTGRTLCRHFGTFLAAEKAWARINAESRICVWWNNDSNEEEKGNWDSKRLLKVKVSL